MTLTLTLPRGESVYNGKQVTFVAPCESEGLTGVIVDGTTYDLVSAMGSILVANSFNAGAMVSVIFDVATRKAYVQNADTNAYLEGELAKIQQDIADLKYSPISISKFTADPSVVEVGSTINTATLTWATNKKPKELYLDDAVQSANSASGTINLTNLGLTASSPSWTKKWTLKAIDERSKEVTRSVTIAAHHGVFYGVMDDGATIDSAAIRKLNRSLRSDKNITFTVTTKENQRITFALPTSGYGAEPIFTINTVPYKWNKVATFSFENSSGHIESYDVWQEPNIIPGTTTVAVS